MIVIGWTGAVEDNLADDLPPVVVFDAAVEQIPASPIVMKKSRSLTPFDRPELKHQVRPT
jgi:hypothetical protein